MKKFLKLMRVKHYMKNGLVLLPLFFSNKLLDWNLDLKVVLAFISFSFMCSVVYIINDLRDIDNDRKHPIKKNRPLASGAVTPLQAKILLAILFAISVTTNIVFFNVEALILVLLYLGLNLLYSFGLKNVPLLDVTILVSGFLIRVLYGASIVDVSVSSWLYLTIMSMAFYLGLGKRRKELEKNSDKSRKVLSKYNKEFLDKNMYLCMGLTIVFYALWSIDPMIATLHPGIIWTVPVVLLICMKYSLDVEQSSYGDPVDVVIKDKVLLGMVFVYIIIIIYLFYGNNFLGI